MADTTKQKAADEPTPEQAAKEAVKETEPPEDAESIPVERLIHEPFTSYPSHVVAGALHGVNRQNLTVEEAEAAVKAWLQTPVKEG
jgi:hypothetical protein